MKAADFIGLLFLARDVAHSVHLNTRSYATHKALEEFYSALPGLADKFAETYQGAYELIGPVTLQSAGKNNDIVEFLQDQIDALNKGRYEVCDKAFTPLQNVIDEIIAHYLTSLYKLRFLS